MVRILLPLLLFFFREISSQELNCRHLDTINGTNFQAFYDQCKDKDVLMFKRGATLEISPAYVSQAQLNHLFKNVPRIIFACIQLTDPKCSLKLKFGDEVKIAGNCKQDPMNVHYDRPRLLFINNKNAACQHRIQLKSYNIGREGRTGSFKLRKLATPKVSLVMAREGWPEFDDTDISDLTTIGKPVGKREMRSPGNISKLPEFEYPEAIIGDVIFTEEFPFNDEIGSITIHGCYKVKGALNARSLQQFERISVIDEAICHGERAIEFIDNPNLCIPQDAFFNPADLGATYDSLMKPIFKKITVKEVASNFRREDCDMVCGSYGHKFTTKRLHEISDTIPANKTCRYFEGNLVVNSRPASRSVLASIREIYGSLTFVRDINIRRTFQMLRGVEDYGLQVYRQPVLSWSIDKMTPSKRKSLAEFSFQMTKFSFVMAKSGRTPVRWSTDVGQIDSSHVFAFAGMSPEQDIIDIASLKRKRRMEHARVNDKQLKKSMRKTMEAFRDSKKEAPKKFWQEDWFHWFAGIFLSVAIGGVLYLILHYFAPIRYVFYMPVDPPMVNPDARFVETLQDVVRPYLIRTPEHNAMDVQHYILRNREPLKKWIIENRQWQTAMDSDEEAFCIDE